MLKVATLKAAVAQLERSPRGTVVTATLVNDNQTDVVPVGLALHNGDIFWQPHPNATHVEGHGQWEKLPPLQPHTLGHELRVRYPDNTWKSHRYPPPPPMFDNALDTQERESSSVTNVSLHDWHAVGSRAQNGQQRAPEGEASSLPPGTQVTPRVHRSQQGAYSVQSIESRQSHSEDVVEVRRTRRRELGDYVRANFGYRGGINYTAAAADFSRSYVTVDEADLRRAMVKGTMFDSYDSAPKHAHAALVARALDSVLPLGFTTDF